MDDNSVPGKPIFKGNRINVGLCALAVVYAALSIYLMTQTGHPPNVEKYPSALSWITATNSFALIGSLFGVLVTLPACKQKTLGSLTVLCYTVSFFLAVASLLFVVFSYFSIYWIGFCGVHVFISMMGVGAAYAHFRALSSQEELEETLPIAASLPVATESA
ncbi:hypothetical protein cyc_01210 [Cyclospora cayetanensis]|nr:hypothetical protein cyc_01210 [Cyclospora cayetanensis]